MPGEHIVKSFDEELDHLNRNILEMGRLAADQIEAAIEALLTQDQELAKQIVKSDKAINALANDTDLQTVRILALRQPVAVDVRTIIASGKIASDLERIADYAKGVAKHVIEMRESTLDASLEPVVEMAKLCLRMLRETMTAYRDRNAEQGITARKTDKAVDALYKGLIESLRVCMVRNGQTVNTCTSLLLVARHLERIGDHIKNIANHVYYLVHGEPYRKKI